MLDDCTHRGQLFSFLVGYLLPKLFFQCHHQLNGVQRVRPQVLNELGFGRNLLGLNAQLLLDDSLNLALSTIILSHIALEFWDACQPKPIDRQAPIRFYLFTKSYHHSSIHREHLSGDVASSGSR